jgi:peroxisome-assembly ATPase
MLMDMFYNSIPESQTKMRIHFNKFMLNIHKSIHEIKSKEASSKNPLPIVADQLIAKAEWLFLDEFQVTDIVDAMLMSNLFEALFERGLLLFSTSNRTPIDLYKNGLQRELFLPFIDVLNGYCQVIKLDSNIDYRKISKLSPNRHFFHCEFENHLLDNIVGMLINQQDGVQSEESDLRINLNKLKSMNLDILGREVFLEKTYKRLLDTKFTFMCEEARSAVDYLDLCKLFDVIVLRNVPMLTLDDPNVLRRFITFIDVAYDNHIKLICSAKCITPSLLFKHDISNKGQDGSFHSIKKESKFASNTDEIQTYANNKASLYTLEEEVFAINRTISRLIDMQSKEYLKKTRDNLKN